MTKRSLLSFALVSLFTMPSFAGMSAAPQSSGGMPFRPATSVEVSFVAGVLMTMDPVQAKISPETLESLRAAVASENSAALAGPLVEAANSVDAEGGERQNVVRRAGEIIESRIADLVSAVPGEDATAEGLESRIAALQSLQSIAKVYKTAGTRRLSAAIAQARGQLEMVRARGIAEAVAPESGAAGAMSMGLESLADQLVLSNDSNESLRILREMTVLANQPGESDQTRRFAAKVILDDLTSDRLTTAYRYAALAFVRRIAGNSGDATSKGYIVALLERNMNLSNAPDHWASLQRTIDTIAATAGGRDNLDVPVLSSSEKRAGRLEARAIPKPAADEEYVPPPTEDRARGAKGVSGAGITNVGSWSERAVAQLKRWKYELLEGIDAADAILGAAFVGYAVFSALKMVHLGAPLLALFVALPAYAYMMTKGFFHRHPWSAWFQLIVISCFFETAATATLSLSTLVIGGIGTAALIAVAAAALKSPEDDPQWFGFLANVVLAILFGSAV